MEGIRIQEAHRIVLGFKATNLLNKYWPSNTYLTLLWFCGTKMERHILDHWVCSWSRTQAHEHVCHVQQLIWGCRGTKPALPKYLWHSDYFKVKTIKAQDSWRNLDLISNFLKNLYRGSIRGIELSPKKRARSVAENWPLCTGTELSLGDKF